MHGQFVWYELMTSDSVAAKSFYPRLTGWGTEEWDRETYTMWTVNDQPIGGIVQLRPHQLDEGMRPNWLPYIEVDDVDEGVERVGALGGLVLFGPKDIPGTGRFAVVADPQGATFAIYRPFDRAQPFDGRRQLGRFVWHELITTNPIAAFEFYSAMFGWEGTSEFDMGPEMGRYQMFGHGKAEYGGIYKLTWQWGKAPPQWICYAHVRDVRKATAAAGRAGATVMIESMEVPGGDVIGMLTDPQGAIFAVHQDAQARRGTAVGRAVEKSAGKAVGKSVERAGKKTVRKPARKAVKKRVKKVVKKAKKAVKKTVKKAAKKAPAKKRRR